MRVQGFTLVELLVVLTLMALVAGSISFVVMQKGDDLQSLSNDIVLSMRLTQLRAIREGRPYQIEIDLENNSIEFFEKIINLPDTYFLTVKTASNLVIDEQTVGMTFYPDASSTGGSILLESDTEMFEINVIWITGKINTRFSGRTT